MGIKSMGVKLLVVFAGLLFLISAFGCGGSSASAPVGPAPADDGQVTGSPVERTPPREKG